MIGKNALMGFTSVPLSGISNQGLGPPSFPMGQVLSAKSLDDSFKILNDYLNTSAGNIETLRGEIITSTPEQKAIQALYDAINPEVRQRAMAYLFYKGRR